MTAHQSHIAENVRSKYVYLNSTPCEKELWFAADGHILDILEGIELILQSITTSTNTVFCRIHAPPQIDAPPPQFFYHVPEDSSPKIYMTT